MKLYTYFQSSAAYRVRIALNLKGLTAESAYIDLAHGDQRCEFYEGVNPQRLVPSLMVGPDVLTQSIAIMEYLEEAHPERPILPKDLIARAQCRAIAQIIASDIAVLNNLKVRDRLKAEFGMSDDALREQWVQHWIYDGFAALEAVLARSKHTGNFCVGNFPTIADCCLVPQMFNAQRFKCDVTAFPTICRIVDACEDLPAFASAHPSKQADAA